MINNNRFYDLSRVMQTFFKKAERKLSIVQEHFLKAISVVVKVELKGIF